MIKNITIYIILLLSLKLFIGCDGGSSSSTPQISLPPSTYSELYIKSAVYSDNATATTVDDKLYIYFNKSIDENSISVDTSANFIIDGVGAIGSASSVDYNDTFYKLTINQDDGSTGSIAISTNNDVNISLANMTISALNGDFPSDYNKTIVEKFRTILKTGQTTSYPDNNASDRDDGDYESGVVRSYTDNGDGTVRDNSMGLIWETEDDDLTRNWADADSYCSALNLGGIK